VDGGGAAQLEVTLRDGRVKNQEAALRTLVQVLGLQPRGVQRELQLAVLIQEPDDCLLGDPVSADRRQRREVGVEQIMMGLGEWCHSANPPEKPPPQLQSCRRATRSRRRAQDGRSAGTSARSYDRR